MKVRYQSNKNQRSEKDSEVYNVVIKGKARLVHNGSEDLYKAIKAAIDRVQSEKDDAANGYAIIEGLALITNEVIAALIAAAKVNKGCMTGKKSERIQEVIESVHDNYMWALLNDLYISYTLKDA